MKNWEYYNKPKDIEYFGYEEKKAFEKALLDEINNSPMTAAEREEALANVKKQVVAHVNEQNKPYREAAAKLQAEFWADAREDLGYDDFLTKKGVEILESKAYEDGHSSGFSEIYGHLQDLTDFCQKIVENHK